MILFAVSQITLMPFNVILYLFLHHSRISLGPSRLIILHFSALRDQTCFGCFCSDVSTEWLNQESVKMRAKWYNNFRSVFLKKLNLLSSVLFLFLFLFLLKPITLFLSTKLTLRFKSIVLHVIVYVCQFELLLHGTIFPRWNVFFFPAILSILMLLPFCFFSSQSLLFVNIYYDFPVFILR